MPDFHTHKEIGYELMLMLSESIDSASLHDINQDGLYQDLVLKNDFSIQFTRWRNGTMPFYFIVFNNERRYIFELDLSMLIEKEDNYSWNLKIPSNKVTKNKLIELYGNEVRFNHAYTELVKKQKEILKSGVNTPRNGYLFLDDVDWDTLCVKLCELAKSIIEAHVGSNLKFNVQYQAVDDDIDSFQMISARMRRGQRLFRKNLIDLYGGKCTISGWGPTEVLEAVHIVNHAESGINHTDNGIILRADLHRLFDSNLFRINPDTFCVDVSSELKDSKYWKLNGRRINKRKDGKDPSAEYLKQKWIASTET